MRKDTEVKERLGRIKNYLRNHEGEFVTRVQIAKACQIKSVSTVSNDLNAIKDDFKDGAVEIRHGVGVMFVRFEQPEGSKKNPEGYNDPTAYKALKSVSSKTVLRTGEVYEGSTSNGFTELFIIVKAFADTSLVIKLVDPKIIHGDTSFVHGISYMGQVYAADIRKITTKPNKYITKWCFSLKDGQFDEIMAMIGDLFGCEREKTDPAELQQLKSKLEEKDALLEEARAKLEDKADSIEIRLMKQKIEIYERLLFGDSQILISK